MRRPEATVKPAAPLHQSVRACRKAGPTFAVELRCPTVSTRSRAHVQRRARKCIDQFMIGSNRVVRPQVCTVTAEMRSECLRWASRAGQLALGQNAAPCQTNRWPLICPVGRHAGTCSGDRRNPVSRRPGAQPSSIARQAAGASARARSPDSGRNVGRRLCPPASRSDDHPRGRGRRGVLYLLHDAADLSQAGQPAALHAGRFGAAHGSWQSLRSDRTQAHPS